MAASHDNAQQRVLDDIRKYGCHAIHVQAEGELPGFTYSVGIGRGSDAADLVVVGQPHEAGHRLVHGYHRRLRNGEAFEVGVPVRGFLRDQDCVLRPVHASWHLPMFGWNAWLHGGTGFRMLQLVYPTVEGIWPWDAHASEWLRRHQPLLSEPA